MERLSYYSLNLLTPSLLPSQWQQIINKTLEESIFSHICFPESTISFQREHLGCIRDSRSPLPNPGRWSQASVWVATSAATGTSKKSTGADGDRTHVLELSVSAILCWQPWKCHTPPNLQTFQLAISLRFYSGDRIMPAACELLICNLKNYWFLDQHKELIACTSFLGQFHT